MSKGLICPQNRSKIRQIECKCSRRVKQREERSAVSLSELRFVLTGVCCVCDSKSSDYFAITLKIDQLRSHKNS